MPACLLKTTGDYEFQAIIVGESKERTAGKIVRIRGAQKFPLLRVKADNRQSKIYLCKASAAQLNAIVGPKSNLQFAPREVMVESCIYSNFKYCPLVCHFSFADSL